MGCRNHKFGQAEDYLYSPTSFRRLRPIAFAAILLLSLVLAGDGWTSGVHASGDSTDGRYVPGQLLLKIRAEARQSPDSLEAKYGVAALETMPDLGIARVAVPAGQEMETAGRLQADPAVEWAEPDYLRRAQTVPNDQLYGQYQWNLKKIGMEQAWDVTTGSPDLTVAVLDTGVDSTHPDLAGKLVPGYDFLNDKSDPADDGGHGTHNAGVIGAASNNGMGIAGVAWQARIMPIKVLNSGGVGPDSVIAKGITYAVDHGARVINLSFGSPTASRVLASAVKYAFDKGALLVAAAGNTAKLDNAVIYPAAYDQVLAVGATDESDKVGDFSQHHPYVGVSAPGVHIVSTFWRGGGYGNYVSASGTSSAAPHVSGLAALILSANPNLSNIQVKQLIQNTADDLGAPGRDEYYGAGRINAERALRAVKPAGPPQTAPAPSPGQPPASAPPPAALPRTVWYFAEGSTASPFDLWLLIQNPNSNPVTARVTYMKTDGSQKSQDMVLPPASRRSIYVNDVIPDSEVSMKVESDSLIFAERAMYFGHDGHDSAGVPAPSKNWYFAEGSTRNGFDSWILLQNPLPAPANVLLTFLTPEGRQVQHSIVVPPNSRRSVYANLVAPNLDFATIVSSDQPVVAERAMYFGNGGGHGSFGASQLSRTWYMAEGQAGGGFDTWMLVLNPNQNPANLKVTYMMEDGTTTSAFYVAQPWSRLSLYANDVVPSGRFGARVESDQPVVVERSTYFAGGRGGHNVVASPLAAQEWFLPEGSTKQPFSEVITVLNPGDQVVNLAVTFMKVDGTTAVSYFVMNPTSRLTLNVNDLLPDAEASTKVEADGPVVVERSMYFANGQGGTGALGIPR